KPGIAYPLSNLVQAFLQLGTGNELTKTHVLAQGKCHVPLVRLDLAVWIELIRVFEDADIASRYVHIEPDHRSLRDKDVAELHVLCGNARCRTRIEQAQTFLDHLRTIIVITSAALIDSRVIQKAPHRVGE